MAWQLKRKRKIPGPIFGVVIMVIGVGLHLINDRQASRYADIADASDTVMGQVLQYRSRSGNSAFADFEFTYEGETFLIKRFRVQEGFKHANPRGASVEVLVPQHAPDQAILADNRYFGWIQQLVSVAMMIGGGVRHRCTTMA